MICFWSNDALCLSPENNKERQALATVYHSFRAGFSPDPYEGIGYDWKLRVEEDGSVTVQDLESSLED